jgi:hypothetical protein
VAGRRVVLRRGRFHLRLDEREREYLRQLLGELRALLALGPSDPRLRRLYPSAYTDDPEKEEEYQRLTAEELTRGRLENIDVVERTLDAQQLSEDELTAWMQSVNSLRLILGTILDITEDGQEPVFEPGHPNAPAVVLYGYLAGLLDEIVDAQLDKL